MKTHGAAKEPCHPPTHQNPCLPLCMPSIPPMTPPCPSGAMSVAFSLLLPLCFLGIVHATENTLLISLPILEYHNSVVLELK